MVETDKVFCRKKTCQVADFHICVEGVAPQDWGYKGQQKLKNVCDLHTLKLAKTVKICL